MKRVFIFVGFIFLSLNYLSSFTLSPMSLKYDSSVKTKSFFTVKNVKDVPIGVDVEVLTRSITRLGKEINEKDNGDFIFFPKQFVLMPGQEKIVKLQFTKAPPKKELAYRFLATEIPIKSGVPKEESGMIINFQYKASVYVQPVKKVSNKLKVVNHQLSKVTDENGYTTEYAVIDVLNEGTMHELLKNFNLNITDRNGLETYDISKLIPDAGNVLPGNILTIRVSNAQVIESMKTNRNLTLKISE